MKYRPKPPIRKFRVYPVADEPDLKSWQELRDGGRIMNYEARRSPDGLWVLHSRMGGRTAETERGDLMGTFGDLETLCTFLGVPVIGE